MTSVANSPTSDFAAQPQGLEASSRTLAIVREIVALVAIVVLADLTIYRGAGFAGLALLFVLGPLLLLLGTQRPAVRLEVVVVGLMLALLAFRLIWQGSVLGIICGGVLIIALTMGLRGLPPYFTVLLAGLGQLFVAGIFAVAEYGRQLAAIAPRLPRFVWLNVLLPLAAVTVFGTLFILANPDLVQSISSNLRRFIDHLTGWWLDLEYHLPEIAFIIVAAYVVLGLLRPIVSQSNLFRGQLTFDVPYAEVVDRPEPSRLYAAIRNMLAALIVLFAVYLTFEFATLWFREFPKGFHYSGYAHRGAAWLTAALATVTLVLSIIFRGAVLRDPRLARLKLLAGIWTIESFVLALTVYHRMYIYIDFNGMTRMRTVGLFGITTVIIGLALVVWKVAQGRDFLWLIHRQLWALAAAVLVFAITPVDYLVHSYNARQILAGDLAPSVQISVHPISSEGFLVLLPLTHSSEPAIREGVKAMLAQQEIEAAKREKERQRLGWTSFQWGDRILHDRLGREAANWRDYRDAKSRDAAIQRFKDYAYQWY